MKIDTLARLETPEGIELPISHAGPLPRILAWFIDFLIRAAVFIAISLVILWLDIGGQGFLLISIFVIEWFYPVLFEMFMDGQTPGKRIFAIQVLQTDGRPISWGSSLVRNLLRVVDFLPFLYGIGVISMLTTQRFQRLGDIAASTIVCYRPIAAKPHQLPQAEARPPEIALSVDEQQAILGYAERFDRFTPERAEEIAKLASPLIKKTDSSASSQILGIAHWLNGKT